MNTKYNDRAQPLRLRINDLMLRMTLEEKIGSIMSGGGSVPAKEASPKTWINMVNEFKKGSLSTRLGIPVMDPELKKIRASYYDPIRKGVATIKGFVISDFMGIDMITDPAYANYAYLIEQSVTAGVDMNQQDMAMQAMCIDQSMNPLRKRMARIFAVPTHADNNGNQCGR
nr:glycoside hydrolase family 3 C-terminal domain-containing protein [Tanacetum cinerariifolium]